MIRNFILYFAGVFTTIFLEALGTDFWGRIKREFNIARSKGNQLKGENESEFYVIPDAFVHETVFEEDTALFVVNFKVLNKSDVELNCENVSLMVENKVSSEIEIQEIYENEFNRIPLTIENGYGSNIEINLSPLPNFLMEPIDPYSPQSEERTIIFKSADFVPENKESIKGRLVIGTPYSWNQISFEVDFRRSRDIEQYSLE